MDPSRPVDPSQLASGAPVDPPEYLFAAVPEALAAGLTFDAAVPGALALRSEQGAPVAPGEALLVVEAGRAARHGVSITCTGPGAFQATALPGRYVLSLRPGFEQQVSAGGVLAIGRGDDARFALIRTLPRGQDPPDIEDPRRPEDRRGEEDRRRTELPPPDGVDRRRAPRRQNGRRRRGAWGPNGRLELPKGKLEPGETPEQAAVREVREELGIADRVEVLAALSKNHYLFRTPEGKSIFKTVHYYLLACPDGAPQFHPRREEGIVSVEWWSADRAISHVAFRNLRPVLERAWTLVQASG